jgi:hypothetical protein
VRRTLRGSEEEEGCNFIPCHVILTHPGSFLSLTFFSYFQLTFPFNFNR